jgi:hypothetical protein
MVLTKYEQSPISDELRQSSNDTNKLSKQFSRVNFFFRTLDMKVIDEIPKYDAS